MTYSLLTERRRHAPPGAEGGADGERGRNLLDGASCRRRPRDPSLRGQNLQIHTPGGGGKGSPQGE